MAEAKAPISRYLIVDSCEARVSHFRNLTSPGCSVPLPCLAENPHKMYREIEKISSEMNAVIRLPDLAMNIMPTTVISTRQKYSDLFSLSGLG